MPHLMVYGLQRSGTNYMEKLLPSNFKDVHLENVAYHRSLPLHKHFRLYDEMYYVPEPKYLNNFSYPSFSDLDAHVQRLTGKEILHYVVVVKEPYSWYISYCKLAQKNNWPTYMKKWANQHYMIDYSLFVRKWLDFQAEAPDKVVVLRYEDLLADLEGSLEQIRTKFGLEMKHDSYQNFSKVNMSKKFGEKRRQYYLNKEFLNLLTDEELYVLTENLDPTVVEELNYELFRR
jgi:hypothetical protein